MKLFKNGEKVAETTKNTVINDEHKNIQDPIEKIIVKYQIPPVF